MSENDEKLSIEFVDEWIYISGPSFHFSGAYSKSENKKYILAWRENLQVTEEDNDASEIKDETSDDDDFLTKEEEKLYTKYQEQEFKEGFLLIENQKILLKVFLPQPAYGKVTNNGSFIINSSPGGSNELKGRFIAYNKMGEQLIAHEFTANLGVNSLSDDGKYAICQTWYSDTSDGHTITCFDLTNKKLLWQKMPETRVADVIKFDCKEGNIILIYDNIGSFRYSLTGELIDKTQWYEAQISYGTGYEIIEIANQKLITMADTIDLVTIDEVLDLYFMAIKRIDSDYFLAKAHRKIGELYLLIDKVDRAIIHFEKAQELNPKIGIKKKLEKMKRANQRINSEFDN